MSFQDSHYNHVFDTIGLYVIGEAVEGYKNFANNSEMTDKEIEIEAKLSLWIVNESEIVLAHIEFDNGYKHEFGPSPNHSPQLNIFQDAYIGKTWYLPDDDQIFY